MHRRRILWGLLAIVGLALVGWFLSPAAVQAHPTADEGDTTLYIMHTNDVHAHIEQFNKYGGFCDEEHAAEGKCFGGVARRMTAVKQIRSEHPDALLLDAGDEFMGTLFYTQYKGKATQEFMNMLGYSAMTLGNHEFDSGPEVLAEFIKGLEFPMVAANVDVSHDPNLQDLVKHYTILTVDGQQVGIIGVDTELTGILSSPGANVKFTDPIEAVKKYAAELEGQGVKIIIVLSHLGYLRDQQLAEQVEGVDVIVGGHTHTFLANDNEKAAGPYPTVVDSPRGEPVLIVTDKAYGQYLGYLTVTFKDGVATQWEGNPILLDASVEEHPGTLARVQELAQPLNELRKQVIGQSTVELDGDRGSCRFQECTMGNLVTDALLWALQEQGVQVALQNGGGIRASIPAGDVTVGHVLEVLPFGNTVATFGLKGSDLLAVLENGVSRADNPENEGTGRFLQVAGLRYVWDPTQPEGQRIVSVEVRNPDGSYSPLDPDAVYQVAANNYIRNGGDGYSVLKDNAIDPYDFGPLLADVVMSYIKANSPVEAQIEGRIQQGQAPAPTPEATATPEPTATPKPQPTATSAPPEPTAQPTPPAEEPASASWIWVIAVLLVLVGGLAVALTRKE